MLGNALVNVIGRTDVIVGAVVVQDVNTSTGHERRGALARFGL
jgi:hypothetical protein